MSQDSDSPHQIDRGPATGPSEPHIRYWLQCEQASWRQIHEGPFIERVLDATERQLWGAVAQGFGLPYASAREVLWPVFWRRAAARVGGVANLWDPETGVYRDGCAIWPAGAVPGWPWLDYTHMMRRAIEQARTDPSLSARMQRGHWLYALACCEKELEVELAAWIAPMEEDSQTWVRNSLGEWPTERPEALLDYLTAEYSRHDGFLLA